MTLEEQISAQQKRIDELKKYDYHNMTTIEIMAEYQKLISLLWLKLQYLINEKKCVNQE